MAQIIIMFNLGQYWNHDYHDYSQQPSNTLETTQKTPAAT